MKQTLILLGSVIAAISSPALATTVGFNPAPTARSVVDSTLTNLPTNSLVWAGTFASESFTFNPAISVAANVAAITLAGTWTQFINTDATNPSPLGLTVVSAGPKVSGQVVDKNATAAPFNALPIYLWIFNAPTVAGATQMGIFHAVAPVGVPWTFPTNGGGVGDVLTYSTGSQGTNSPAVNAIGGAGVVTNGAGTVPSPGTLQLVAAVPEPSVLALGGMAAVGMLASRKRRQRK